MSNIKVILITGASSGMGKTTAQDLIKAGYTVYCTARNVDKMQDLAELGGHVLKMDVTDEADIENAVNQIITEQGCIDVLWNNAGYGLYGAVEEVPMDKARMQFDVNVFGVASVTQKVLPHMREKNNGLIINTSSISGKLYTPLGAWYHASKHAIEGFSDCLRLELKGFNIRVVILEPGVIHTNFYQVVSNNFFFKVNSPYKTLIDIYLKAIEHSLTEGANPQVISDTIQKIIKTPKPKSRYFVGQWAYLLTLIRRFLGDRVYDALMLSQLKK